MQLSALTREFDGVKHPLTHLTPHWPCKCCPQAASSGTAEVDLGYSSKVQMFGIESISALSFDMQQDSKPICRVRLVHSCCQSEVCYTTGSKTSHLTVSLGHTLNLILLLDGVAASTKQKVSQDELTSE